MSNCRNAGWSSPHNADGVCGRWRWSPFEIAAMVLGFVVFWPLGLSILCAKAWQRNVGADGDVFSFVRDRVYQIKETVFGSGPPSNGAAPFRRSSGNTAFDDWRESELKRLEEERRKLADAEREFAKHIEELRRARDREEFESFMRARKSGQA